MGNAGFISSTVLAQFNDDWRRFYEFKAWVLLG